MRGIRRRQDLTSVWEMLDECARHLHEPFKRSEIVHWFRQHHPQVSETALTAQIQAATQDPLQEGQFGSRQPLLVRVGRGAYRRYRSPEDTAAEVTSHALVLLVGGGPRTRMRPGPAADLYRGAFFARARDYAAATGRTWYVLSSRYGAVAPDAIIGPYEGRLTDRSPSYREAWGAWVTAQLVDELGELGGTRFEMHANESYVTPLRDRLGAVGATVAEPVAGLGREERIAWYDARVARPAADVETAPELSEELLLGLVDQVGDLDAAVSIDQLSTTKSQELGQPGLYSWFVDADGALELSAGAGHVIRAGLVYAGLAGGTRRSAGGRAADTLGGRLLDVHLAPNTRVSTFRHTLAAVLRPVHGWDTVDEMALTHWMHQHLRVVTVPVTDAGILDVVETAVLGALDPPLNLGKVPRTPLRLHLVELRRAV